MESNNIKPRMERNKEHGTFEIPFKTEYYKKWVRNHENVY